MHVARRDFLIGSALLLGSATAHAQPEDRIARIEQVLGGRVGVSALDTASGARIRHRADERFAMCSTFKAALVGAILTRVDRGALALGRQVQFGEHDLLSNAPVAAAHVGQGVLSLEALCAAAVEVSDNTAANLLLSLIGGPPKLTEFFRAIGDTASRLDRIELDLNSNLPDDPRDTTTPDAMAGTLKALLLGDVLSTASRSRLTDWMIHEQNGRSRIRAGLPPDWRVANKPGTSAESAGATNDIAVAWPPGRAPIVLAVYTDARGATLENRIAAIADVARGVASAFV
jgi:beta-lactamase class A